MTSNRPKIAVLQTGVANTASVVAGLQKAGGAPFLTQDPTAIESTPFVVLPGVGTFGASMETLVAHNLVQPLRKRIENLQPTLLVCVGFQLLFEASEESPGAKGLGILSGTVRRFPDSVRVPQFGWNLVSPDEQSEIVQEGFAYFANSYRAEAVNPGWSAAYSDNGGKFVAAVEKGSVLGCQFHPELSSSWGISLLSRWITSA